ncbi:MAG: ATP-binding cassette domain-containing protein [Halanaerobiales bacterium]|nr:ATP-binding cassette domain-containing protein [Halanaerobiales bacterium]
MVVVNIDSIYKSYGIHEVLKNFSMSVNKGEKVALIGANGSGKTTIFKIINGDEEFQQGNLSLKNDISIGLLDQEPEFDLNNNIYQELLTVFSHLKELEKKLKSYEKKISSFDKDNDNKQKLDVLMEEYSQLSHKYEINGGYEYENKIIQVSAGLGFDKKDLKKKISYLSGGEKSRVGLIKLLLKNPDILLLDEPTNHLDISSIQWLEEFLINYNGAVIIISHDRYFLDQVIERIVEINGGKEEKYYGNYSYYLEERKKRFEQRMKEYKDQQKKIKKLEESIHQLRVWGRSRDSEKMFKKAKAMEKRLERIDEMDKPTLHGKKMNLNLKFNRRSGDEVLKVENICKKFEDDKILKNLNLDLYWQDKAVIIGANGSGKSTLLDIINGDLKADDGEVKIGASVKMGYYRQEFDVFDPEDDLVTTLIKECDMKISEARDALGAFLFSDQEVFKKIKNLSGGEKSRLRLLQLMSGDYNFLILDEPTNHLDLPSREVLEEVLKDYPGTILVVSHDRYFINKIVDYTYELENRNLTKYYGNYEYYKEKKDELKSNNNLDKKNKKKENKDNYYFRQKKREREERKRKRKKEEIENEIEENEILKNEIEQKMTKPEIIEDYKKLNKLKQKHQEIKEKLKVLYNKWEEVID